MSLAPIILFTYNRPDHARQVIDALKQNPLSIESELFIFSDGPKDAEAQVEVEAVRTLAHNTEGFKDVHVIERPNNFGLAKSIIDGVGQIIETHGKVIVLEDDIVVSPHFLDYMNTALDTYEHEDRVVSIHGYIYPVEKELPETFFLKGADCWGWATWKRGWDVFETNGSALLAKLRERGLEREFDFNGSYPYTRMLEQQVAGNNNSWAIRWYASAFLEDKLTLYPGNSLVQNIGLDGSGVHCPDSDSHTVQEFAKNGPIHFFPEELEEDVQAKNTIASYFRTYKYKGLFRRIIKRLKNSISYA